ncbi:MAG: hypothetical protein ACYDAG_04365 [Chloroflexota bacterium]
MDHEERSAMWTYIGVMVGFKVLTLVLILIYTHSVTMVALILALHVPWIVAALAMLCVPGTFWYRMFRMRARRAELIRQEFAEEPQPLAT